MSIQTSFNQIMKIGRLSNLDIFMKHLFTITGLRVQISRKVEKYDK